MRRAARAAQALTLLSIAQLAWQASARAEGDRLEVVPSANPNQPRFGLEYRGAMRGTFGAELPMFSKNHAEGFALVLAPLFELHEPPGSDQVLPSRYWRARLPLELVYHTTVSDGPVDGPHALAHTRLRFGLALEHESDHESAHRYSKPGFLALNDLALRARVLRGTDVVWMAGVEAAVYVASCTELAAPCKNFAGSTSFGAALELGVDFAHQQVLGLHPFAAVFANLLAGHDQLAPERRITGQLGLHRAAGPLDYQVYVGAFAGHDLGRTRDRSFSALEAGARLVLDLWPDPPPPPSFASLTTHPGLSI